jgi:hypothetical protein
MYAQVKSIEDMKSIGHIMDVLLEEYSEAKRNINNAWDEIESEEKSMIRKKSEIEDRYQQELSSMQSGEEK